LELEKIDFDGKKTDAKPIGSHKTGLVVGINAFFIDRECDKTELGTSLEAE
jgi:hypothetical protein